MPFSAATSVAAALVLPFAQPLSDSELADTVTTVLPSVQRYAAVQLYYQSGRLPTAEMVDCWWAYTGSELIGDSARPTLTVPTRLDGLHFDGSAVSIDLRIDVATSTPG
ncbi:hypothetical protein SAMN04488241_1193 [Sphingomonas rubra]|uniref:Uncharacterized protein n=1 Tax=Sphingomonas rubra TaxID=634430 RepID=A0A1I5UXG2_9SPHN|nr:hypothetical protein SAMN04488241_1193 [Sphingomonas rubra]